MFLNEQSYSQTKNHIVERHNHLLNEEVVFSKELNKLLTSKSMFCQETGTDEQITRPLYPYALPHEFFIYYNIYIYTYGYMVILSPFYMPLYHICSRHLIRLQTL